MNAIALKTPTFGGFFGDLEKEIDSVMESPWKTTDTGYRADVDITEDESGYTLSFDVPGVEKEDIDIEVKDATLTVTGERKARDEVKRNSYAYRERSYGAFSRSFKLPNSVSGEISAKLENGVLRVSLTKAPEAKAKRIEVK